MYNDDDRREFLKQNGWEQVMTEEDGCESWSFPWDRRKEWHPDTLYRYGTQHFWDLEDAVTLQNQSLAWKRSKDNTISEPERYYILRNKKDGSFMSHHDCYPIVGNPTATWDFRHALICTKHDIKHYILPYPINADFDILEIPTLPTKERFTYTPHSNMS